MKKKNYRILTLVFAGLMLLSGCGASSKSADMAAAESASYNTSAAAEYKEEAAEYDMADDAEAEEGMAVADVAADAGSGVESPTQGTKSNRKLIKRQYITMETKEFDALTQFVQDKVNAVGGYIEYSGVSGSSYNYNDTRYANYTIRVPVTELDGFVNAVKKEGNVTNFSESVEDITLNYVDTESRIAALKTEQETLMEMLEQAGDLDTLLAIQSRLTEVRYQLESYESQLRVYDNDIDYSTVNLEIYEVERETKVADNSFGSRLRERLSANFYGLGQGLESFAIFMIGGIPYWIMLALAVIIVVLIIKLIRRRARKKDQRIAMEMGFMEEDQNVMPDDGTAGRDDSEQK